MVNLGTVKSVGYLHNFPGTTDQLNFVYFGLVRCSILVSDLQHNVGSDLFARSIHNEQIHLNARSFTLTLVHDVRANLNEVGVSKKARTAPHHFELLGIDRPLDDSRVQISFELRSSGLFFILNLEFQANQNASPVALRLESNRSNRPRREARKWQCCPLHCYSLYLGFCPLT